MSDLVTISSSQFLNFKANFKRRKLNELFFVLLLDRSNPKDEIKEYFLRVTV